MSLARDDIGILGALDALKIDFIKSRTLEKKDSPKTSDSEQEPEIKDVFEKNSNGNKKNVEELQENYNFLEVKKDVLTEIDVSLERIDSSEKEITEENFKEIAKVIEQIVPEGTRAEESVEEEPPARDDSEKQEEEDSVKRINELRAKVNEKQQQIAHLQETLYNEVSSLVELRLNADDNSEETVEQQAESLKQSVVEGISQNPETSHKMQITNLNKDMILAMLSLRL